MQKHGACGSGSMGDFQQRLQEGLKIESPGVHSLDF